MLEASTKVFELTKEIKALNKAIDESSVKGIEAYNKEYGTTLETLEDLNAELEKQKSIEADLAIAAAKTKKEKEIKTKEYEDTKTDKAFVAQLESDEAHQQALKDIHQQSNKINSLLKLKNSFLSDEESTRKEIIRNLDNEIEKQEGIFNLSKKAIADMQKKLDIEQTYLSTIKKLEKDELELAETEEERNRIDAEKRLFSDVIKAIAYNIKNKTAGESVQYEDVTIALKAERTSNIPLELLTSKDRAYL